MVKALFGMTCPPDEQCDVRFRGRERVFVPRHSTACLHEGMRQASHTCVMHGAAEGRGKSGLFCRAGSVLGGGTVGFGSLRFAVSRARFAVRRRRGRRTVST